jgi:hypothetical protein
MAPFLAPVAPFLALILAAAALHKIVARDRLAAATARLVGVPLGKGRVLSYGAAAVEAGAAVALCWPAAATVGAAIAAGLWGLYATLLLVRTTHGEEAFDCGCAFARPAHSAHARTAAARPLALAALATLLLLARPVGGLAIEPVCAALAFFMLYVAAGEMAALPSLRRISAS